MKWEIERTHISDITDNTNFGVCPRCGATGLDENVTICPPCGMNLGSKASFLNPNDVMHPNPSFAPALPGTFTCITFQCHFMGQLGFSLAGDGPVLVNRLLKVSRGHGVVSEGTLLSSQGPNMELLLAHSALKVTPGDVVISVDGITVTHLNTEELTRFIRHRKEFLSHQYGTDLTPMTVLFRRHYIEELHNLPSVVETDTTLYPVAEFEIMHSPEVTVALMRNSEAPPNKSDSYDINYADAPYAAAANLGYQHTSYVGTTTPVMVNEPVAPQANGTDPYGSAN